MKAIDILEYCSQYKSNGEYNNKVYRNDSILHAAIIVNELFEKAANEENKVVNMYCGKFSLFREETKNAIDNLKISCDTSDLDEARIEEWKNFQPFETLQKTIDRFVDTSETQLNLIIERELESLKNCQIWKTLKKGISSGNVKLFILHDSVGLEHFTVTEEAYRLESSDGKKTAYGCFKDKANASILNDNFNFLKSISQPVSI